MDASYCSLPLTAAVRISSHGHTSNGSEPSPFILCGRFRNPVLLYSVGKTPGVSALGPLRRSRRRSFCDGSSHNISRRGTSGWYQPQSRVYGYQGENIRRVSDVAKLMADTGLIVIGASSPISRSVCDTHLEEC